MSGGKIYRNIAGFTLIEIMIVIAIIGILAAIAMPNYVTFRAKANCASAEHDAQTIIRVLSDYFSVPSRDTIVTPISITGNATNGIPTVSSGITFALLSVNNTATISGVLGNLTIAVTDGSGQCPNTYQNSNVNWLNNIYTTTY